MPIRTRAARSAIAGSRAARCIRFGRISAALNRRTLPALAREERRKEQERRNAERFRLRLLDAALKRLLRLAAKIPPRASQDGRQDSSAGYPPVRGTAEAG